MKHWVKKNFILKTKKPATLIFNEKSIITPNTIFSEHFYAFLHIKSIQEKIIKSLNLDNKHHIIINTSITTKYYPAPLPFIKTLHHIFNTHGLSITKIEQKQKISKQYLLSKLKQLDSIGLLVVLALCLTGIFKVEHTKIDKKINDHQKQLSYLNKQHQKILDPYAQQIQHQNKTLFQLLKIGLDLPITLKSLWVSSSLLKLKGPFPESPELKTVLNSLKLKGNLNIIQTFNLILIRNIRDNN